MSKQFSLRLKPIELALLSCLGVVAGAIEPALSPAQTLCPPTACACQNILRQARADLKRAEAYRNSRQALRDAGAITQVELATAEESYQYYLDKLSALQNGSTLDPSSGAQLAVAEAEVELTQAELDRYRALFREGAISKSSMRDVEQRYQETVKQRNALRRASPEVLGQPRPACACDQPPPAPGTENSQMPQSALPSSDSSIPPSHDSSIPPSQVGK